VIHFTSDVAAKARLRRRKDEGHQSVVEIVRHEVALTSENALDILKDYDLW